MISKEEAEQYIQDHKIGFKEYAVVVPENTIELNFGWVIYFTSPKAVDELRNKCGLGNAHLDPSHGYYIVDKYTKNVFSVGTLEPLEKQVYKYQEENGYSSEMKILRSETDLYLNFSPLESKMFFLCHGLQIYPSLKEAGYSKILDWRIIKFIWNWLAKILFRPVCKLICKLIKKKKNSE